MVEYHESVIFFRGIKSPLHLPKSTAAKKFVDSCLLCTHYTSRLGQNILHLIATFAPKRVGARGTILQRSLFGRHAMLSFQQVGIQVGVYNNNNNFFNNDNKLY